MFISSGRQVIVPNATFNCNGRIINVMASMLFAGLASNFPLFQVWRPTSLNSSTYNKIDEVKLPPGNRIGGISGYYSTSLSLNSSSQIEFQSGDVIGYYQPSIPQRLIWNLQTSGYTSYSNTASSPLTSIDTDNVDNAEANRQPLIEVTYGKTMSIYA